MVTKIEVMKHSRPEDSGKVELFPTGVIAEFIKWSCDHEEYDSGPGHYPVAVVKHESGQVAVIHASLVRFVDPFPPDPEDEENSTMRWALRNIMSSLPQHRDWLDPEVERVVKDLLKKADR